MSSLRYKLYLFHQIAPLLFTNTIVQNRFGLIFAILKSNSEYKIRLNRDLTVTFKSYQFETLLNLLRVLRLSLTYCIKSDATIELSFDTRNKFHINVSKITPELENLLDLFYLGIINGAIFITEQDNETLKNKKTLKIIEKDGKKIVETYNGIKFNVETYVSGVCEAFVSYIHEMVENENFEDKVVVDIGSAIGDTPLYYASLGAKVFAFEMTKNNFDGMLQNLELNPKYEDKIIPIHAAIGKDGMLDYYQDPMMRTSMQGGASIFLSKFGNSRDTNVKPKKLKVQGYTLGNALKKFKIDNVDLLKMDCKGCEFSLTEDDLKNVKRLKIEYYKVDDGHCLENLLDVLKKSGFKYRIFQLEPLLLKSLNISGNIYAEKIVNTNGMES